MHEDYVTITETAESNGITRQAVYLSIKNGRLKAEKVGVQWLMHKDDVKHYRENRYSRKESKRSTGELLHDPSKGEYSVHQLSKMSGTSIQRIYYLIREGFLKAERIRSAWVIKIDDVSDVRALLDSMYK